MKPHVRTGLLLGLLIIALIALLTGCEQQAGSKPAKLPKDAINVVEKGNGWVEFDLDDCRYLFHRSSYGYNGFEAITKTCHCNCE